MKRVILLSSLLALGLASQPAMAEDHKHHGEHEALPSAPHAQTKSSLYLLKGKLTNTEGKTIELSSLKGKPVIISMFYATCPMACPMLISDIKKIEAKLDEKTKKDLQVVLVTFDPERDTTEALRKLRDAHKVDKSRWSMLRATPDFVEELAAVLGIRYRFGSKGAIHHSTIITLLDREGVIVERIDGLRQPSDDLIKKLKKL